MSGTKGRIHQTFKMVLLVMTTMMLTYPSQGYSQGVLRSSGLGFRLGYLKTAGGTVRFDVSNDPLARQAVSIGGFVGAWAYYYSRLQDNWFLEFNLGFQAGLDTDSQLNDSTKVDLNAMVPLLMGVRYDLLSLRFPSRFQPYLSAGVGPYWQVAAEFEENGGITERASGETKMNFGGYLGVGTHATITSWLSLEMDVKYHFIDFKSSAGNSGVEFGLGLTLMWGRLPELFRVEGTSMIVRDIYPAYYPLYNDYPLALVTVKNTAGFPIEVNVRSRVSPYSRRWKNSGFTKVEKGQRADIPVEAVFGYQLQEVDTRKPAVMEIEIEGQGGGSNLKKEVNASMTVHTRNSWDGEMDKLVYFVTPDHPEIIQFTRNLVNTLADSDRPQIGNLTIAQMIFEELGRLGIQYQSDPNVPFYKDDRVQYATETLQLRSGDCDDLVVLYASLLQSLGIQTAFVRVQDPEKSLAHLYLMFDAGLAPEQAEVISSNEKRYVVRDLQASGQYAGGITRPEQNRVWIPVETTLVPQGFDESWNTGALQYLEEGIVREGLAAGWVEIIDVR